LQSQCPVALLDQVRGVLDALGAGAAAFHYGRGERLDIIQVSLWVGGIGISRNTAAEKRKYDDQAG
jgi:hypothetical protein